MKELIEKCLDKEKHKDIRNSMHKGTEGVHKGLSGVKTWGAEMIAAVLALILVMPGLPAVHAAPNGGGWGLQNGSWIYWEGDHKLTGWHWIDGNGDGIAECYYFMPDGTMCSATNVDGWQLNRDGAWVQDGIVQTQAVTPGSHHPAGSGSNASASGSSSGVIYAGGAGNGTGSITSNVGTASSENNAYGGAAASASSSSSNAGASGGVYTPARARAEAVSLTVSGPQAAYHGKVWTYDDYYVIRSEAKEGQISYTKRCTATGCCNPKGEGLYCEVHTCKEPGCTMGVAFSQYNAGYCYTHMQAHGIDALEFEKLEQEQRRAAAAAAAREQAASYGTGTSSAGSAGSGSAGSSGRKSGSAGSSSGYRSVGSTGSSSGSSGSSGSSYASASSTGSKSTGSSSPSSSLAGSSASSGNKKNTYHDSYDDGYEDVYYNEDYDVDRYNSDWSYMSGVDDAMEDLGEDW